MRYGLCLANFGTYGDPRNVLAIAEEAEAAGWEALLVWDHLSFVWGPPAADPVGDAGRGRRAHRAADPRHEPDARCLAGGRTSSPTRSRRSTCSAAGAPSSPRGSAASSRSSPRSASPSTPRLRAEMLDEGLDVAARRSGRASRSPTTATHYMVDGVELKPRPVQERIPIWIGGNSPPALRRAARFDGWAADSESPEGMRALAGRRCAARIAVDPAERGDEPFDVVVNGQIQRWADPADVRGGRRDLVARDLPRHAGQLRGGARGRTRRPAALAGEPAEHPAEQRVPPARLRERAPFPWSGGSPGSPRAGW